MNKSEVPKAEKNTPSRAEKYPLSAWVVVQQAELDQLQGELDRANELSEYRLKCVEEYRDKSRELEDENWNLRKRPQAYLLAGYLLGKLMEKMLDWWEML
jgi:hypothetical protein